MYRMTTVKATMVAATLVGLLGCDSSNPVSPTAPVSIVIGSFTITVSAVPARLVAGSVDGVTLTVTVTDAATQAPATDGTVVTLNTNLGHFDVSPANQPIRFVSLTLQGVAVAQGR